MKLSRNKIAKLLKIGNQSRKNIKKQHKGRRSKTLGAPHGAPHGSNSNAYLLSEDEMILVPEHNNKRKARSAHLKPKPLNLRFKTLKNRFIREEKREWSGEGGKLTAGQQKVYDLLIKQKGVGNNTNEDILTALSAGKDVPTDFVLKDDFKSRFDELLSVSEQPYEIPARDETGSSYELAAQTKPPANPEAKPEANPEANPEVDFFTKILKGELYYLIDVEDIPKVVTYLSSQPEELKEIITFGGKDETEPKKGGGKNLNKLNVFRSLKTEKEAIKDMTVDASGNYPNAPPEFTEIYKKALQNPNSVATGQKAISMARNYADAAKELQNKELVNYFTDKKTELKKYTAQKSSAEEYARVGKLLKERKGNEPKSGAQNAVTELIMANKTFLENPTAGKIDEVLNLKKELKAVFSAFSDTSDPLTSGRLQTLNILAKINYFYQKMSVYDFVQHQKTSTFGKVFSKGRYTEKAFGSESKGQISDSDRKKFKESKDYLNQLLTAYSEHTDTIMKGSKSSLDPIYFFYELDNAINPSGKVGTIIKAGIKDTIYDNLIRLENSYNKRESIVQEAFYNFYNEQKELTIEQMINKSQENKEWQNFIGTKKTRIEELIKQVNETIIPKARAFITKISGDTEALAAAEADKKEAAAKAGEDKAKQELVQAAQTIVDSLTTVTAYAAATAVDSTEIEHKDDIGKEIEKIDEAVKKLSTTGGTALPSSPALPPASEKQNGGGAAEDIKNNTQVKITLNSFNKSLGKLKGLVGTTTPPTDANLPRSEGEGEGEQTKTEGQGGGGKPEVITALESLQTALAATPQVPETITTEAGKVTEALATITETDGIDKALKDKITAALTTPTKESIDPILVQLKGEGTTEGAETESLDTVIEELNTETKKGQASATTSDIKTTTAEALQKANELLAAVTAAAKLGAAAAAQKPVTQQQQQPSQLSDAEIQALKQRVDELEKKAAVAGKDKETEDEAAIRAIMMGDDAFAHKIQFLVDIPKWQQFKVIGSTEGSTEDAALSMTTDIARASLSDLKKKELDDQKEARKLMGEQLQAIEALKLKMMEKLDPKEKLEAEKKANVAIAELQKQLAKIITRLQSEPQREAKVVNSADPLIGASIDASASANAVPGAQPDATPIIMQLQGDAYKIPSPATKDTLAPIIAALKTLLTTQVIETNKSDDKFKTAFGAKLTEIVNAAKSVKGYDPSTTPANTTEALIKDLPTDFTLPKVNAILENITKLLPTAQVQGGKRLSHHLTKRNNKNRHHGKYTFRNLMRGGVPVKEPAPPGATTPPGDAAAKEDAPAPPGATTPAPSGDAPAPPGDAAAPSGDAPAPSGDAPAPPGATTPPGVAPVPPGDAPAPSGDAPAPSGDAPAPPGATTPAPPGDAQVPPGDAPATEKAAADKKFAELQAVQQQQQTSLNELNISPKTNAVNPTVAATEEATEEAPATTRTTATNQPATTTTAPVTGVTEEVNLDVILTEIHKKNEAVLTCSTWKPTPNVGTCPKQEEFFNAFDETLKLISPAVAEKYANLDRAALEKYIPLIPDKGACKQVVIGTLEDLPPYLYYNKLLMEQNEDAKFSILAAKGWTEGLNQEFVTCAVESHINGQTSCDFAVRLLIPNNPKRMVKQLNGVPSPRITYLELCIVNDIIKTQKDRSISTHKYTGDYPNKSDAENGFDMYFLKIAPQAALEPTAPTAVPPANEPAGQTPAAAAAAAETGGYKRHTRKNKTKKNRKGNKKSKKNKKSKRSKNSKRR
jgi:hypothetical protein